MPPAIALDVYALMHTRIGSWLVAKVVETVRWIFARPLAAAVTEAGLVVADGPLPIGDAIAALGAAWTAYDIYVLRNHFETELVVAIRESLPEARRALEHQIWATLRERVSGLRMVGLRKRAAGENLTAGSQFPPANPWDEPMLNRSALIVRPKKPFCDWLRAVDYEHAPEVMLDEMGPTLYLVPDYEDPADAGKVLGKVCEEIFCRELEGWYTDEDVWPKDRSLKVFKQWFDVQHYEIVEDVGRGPIENDEGPDEKHRFNPSPPPRRPPPRKKPPR